MGSVTSAKLSIRTRVAKLEKMFAGSWTVDAVIEPMPEVGMMQRATSKGTQTTRRGPGGNSLIDEMKSTGATGTINGHGDQADFSLSLEVRKGGNSDMRIAVVRRMITIIRMYEHEDFVWESQRLDRKVILSAREQDTAALEAFMLKEFFEGTHVR